MDEATLRSIYHDDATEDRGPFVGNAQDWVAWALNNLSVAAVTHHGILNSLIEFTGDIAYGETYFHAYHRFGAAPTAMIKDISWPEGDMELILGGRYLDRFERRDCKWKIAYRKTVRDWCRTQAVADGWFYSNPTAHRGTRNIADARLETVVCPAPAPTTE
jgi:hypothetical protein